LPFVAQPWGDEKQQIRPTPAPAPALAVQADLTKMVLAPTDGRVILNLTPMSFSD
jgi:hypothetical protein